MVEDAAFQATRQRQDREQQVVPRHQEIVNQRGIRRLESFQPRQIAGSVDKAISNRGREAAAHIVAEEHYLAGFRNQLGMSGETAGLRRAGEITVALGREGIRIDRERLMASSTASSLPPCHTMLVLATPDSLPRTDGSVVMGLPQLP
jgi:hypothetical protein